MVLLSSEQKVKVGETAPDFKLRGTDGKTYSLHSFPSAKAILVVFGCNHCPYLQAKIGPLNELHSKYSGKGLQIVMINSNDPKQYPEDDFEHMKEFVADRKIRFTYVVDETQEVARAYGAVCTPDPFLLTATGKLAWHGRIDNAMSPEQKATQFDMKEAIESVLAGMKVDKPFLASMGCSIKWKK